MSFSKSLQVGARLPKKSDSPILDADGVGRLDVQLEILKDRLHVAVIHGGNKAEDGAVINRTSNPRAWKSYRTVAEDIASAFARLGFRRVSLIPEDMRLGERLRDAGAQFAWLNTGGVQGRNPMAHAAAFLEMAGIPYVGHDPMTAGILDNKHVFKRQLQSMELPTPRFVVSHLGGASFDPRCDEAFEQVFGGFRGPFVVKPANGRASLHVHLVENARDLPDVVEHVKRESLNHVLIEQYLSGPEYCVAVCGEIVCREGVLERREAPFVFAAVERVLDPDERIFTSQDVRPITADRVRLLDATRERRTLGELEALARKVHESLDLEAIIRLDVRADREGRLFILEANPKPDMKAPGGSRTSLICENLGAYGMSYDDLVLSLLADRIDRLLNRAIGQPSPLRGLLQVRPTQASRAYGGSAANL